MLEKEQRMQRQGELRELRECRCSWVAVGLLIHRWIALGLSLSGVCAIATRSPRSG